MILGMMISNSVRYFPIYYDSQDELMQYLKGKP